MNIKTSKPATNETIRVDLSATDFDAAYALSPDGDDLRVVDADNSTLLDFYIQHWDAASQIAILKIRFPALDTSARTFYLYYGNTYVSSASTAVSNNSPTATLPDTGWRFHTRKSKLNPASTAEARSVFGDLTDSAKGYGCALLGNVLGQSNRNTFKGPRKNYGLYLETHFEVSTPGIWSFRAGMDFGRGGALLVDNEALDERWLDDLWWGYNYNHPDVLTGSVHLSTGYHHIELLGFEGCCDGSVSVQFKAPGSSTWRELSDKNLPLVNHTCPVGKPSLDFVMTDTPNVFGGFVYLDNGTAGVAHDALKSPGEAGIGSVEVDVSVVGASANKTVSSRSDGSWQTCFFNIAAGKDVEVSVAAPVNYLNVSESVGATNKDAPLNSVVRFPVLAGTHYPGILLGYVQTPSLLAANTITVGPGFSGLLPHRYTASSSANVLFQVGQLEHSALGAYTYDIFQDNNCDGELDAIAQPFSNPQSVSAGQEVCLLIKVDGGAGVVESSLLKLQLDAKTSFTGIPLTSLSSNIDVVLGAAAELMVLNRSVCNASERSCDLQTGAGFVVDDTGVPSDELIYRLTFSPTLGRVSDVAVYDAVPSYTKLRPSSISVIHEPSGANCVVEEPLDQTGTEYSGTIKWQCRGEVLLSETGILAFSVYID